MLSIQRVKLDKNRVKGRYAYHAVKRVFDVVASGVALILLSPLFAYLAYKIHKEDGGPAIYTQTRIGKNGKPFTMYKFRSMIVDADKHLKELEEKNEIDGAMFKMKNDPRVTKIGHVIRKYSLDELPQFYNVLLGDMSLVGPRPPLPSEVEEYNDYDMQRLEVTPGCTGLWQVTERNDADFEGMVELDIEYINNSGLLYDLYLMLKTVGVVIHPNSAY